MKHLIMLVPGFFGFSRLGGVYYFRHVEAALERAVRGTGHSVRVVSVPTIPTGSIRKRARRLSEAIYDAGPSEGERVHVVGHSTGGVDARLLVTPGVSLDPRSDAAAEVVHSVVTLATPHFGTPMASFFTSLAGKHLLVAFSLVMVQSMHGVKGRSSALLGRLLSYVSRLDDIFGLDNTILDYFAEQLLADFDATSRDEVLLWADSISKDQGALVQLTPEGMDIFNAAVYDNPDVRYFSYLTAAPRPSLLGLVRGLPDPYYPSSYALFAALCRVAGMDPALYPYPPFPKDLVEAAAFVWGGTPDFRLSDGIVPSCSQIWGHVAGLVRGDHLDVCGHFHAGRGDTSHTDWLRSGAHFTVGTFEQLWTDIALRLIGGAPPISRSEGFVSFPGPASG
jgi:triacylglycerol lipase